MITVRQYFELLLLALNSIMAFIILSPMVFTLSFTLGGLTVGALNVFAAWLMVSSLKDTGFFK